MKKTNLSSDFIQKLIKSIVNFGYRESDIEAILQVGSSLYLKNYGDIDFKVIIKEGTPIPEGIYFPDTKINGIDVDCIFFTPSSWENVINTQPAMFIQESQDMKLVYGSDEHFMRYDCVVDKSVQKYLMNIYNILLFNRTKMSKRIDAKRLWNFLLFAFKYKNKSHKLSKKQLNTLQEAHDLKLDKEEFRGLFNEMKGEILR